MNIDAQKTAGNTLYMNVRKVVKNNSFMIRGKKELIIVLPVVLIIPKKNGLSASGVDALCGEMKMSPTVRTPLKKWKKSKGVVGNYRRIYAYTRAIHS